MAVEIFKLFGSIFVNNDEANESISATDKKASGVASTLGKGIKTAGKWGAALIGGATAGVAALAQVAESTSEYRTEMGKLDTAFITNNFTANDAKQTYTDLYALLGDSGQATEAANHLSLLCGSTEELKSWTEICTGVYAQFGESLPIEGLTEAANETAKTGAVTGSLADAINWMGMAEDEFNNKLAQCSSEQERQQLITSTLTNLYSEASAQYKATNGDLMESNRAQATLNDTMAQLGKIAEPVLNKLMGLLGQLLVKLTPLIESIANKLTPLIINLADQLAPLLISILEKIIPIIEQLLPFTEQLFEALAPIITQILEELLPPLVQIIETILPPLLNIITAILPLVSMIFDVLSPLIAVILQFANILLESLLTSLEPVIVNLMAVLTEAFQPLIPTITEVAGILGETLGPILEQLGPIIGEILLVLVPIIQIFTELISVILPELIPLIQFLADMFSIYLANSLDSVSELVNNLKGYFQGILDFITGVFSGDWEQAWGGTSLSAGLKRNRCQ